MDEIFWRNYTSNISYSNIFQSNYFSHQNGFDYSVPCDYIENCHFSIFCFHIYARVKFCFFNTHENSTDENCNCKLFLKILLQESSVTVSSNKVPWLNCWNILLQFKTFDQILFKCVQVHIQVCVKYDVLYAAVSTCGE